MRRIRALLLALFLGVSSPVLFTACTTPIVQEAPSFNKVLAQAFTSVDVIANLASEALDRDRISIERAEKIANELDTVYSQLTFIQLMGENTGTVATLEDIKKILIKLEKELKNE